MSFKQQEEKRRKKIAQDSAQKSARKNKTASSRFWLTVAVKKTCCARCARIIRIDDELVYRPRPTEALCRVCAELHPEARKARPALRWEQRHRAARKGGSRHGA